MLADDDQKEAHSDRFSGVHSFTCRMHAGGERNAVHV